MVNKLRLLYHGIIMVVRTVWHGMFVFGGGFYDYGYDFWWGEEGNDVTLAKRVSFLKGDRC